MNTYSSMNIHSSKIKKSKIKNNLTPTRVRNLILLSMFSAFCLSNAQTELYSQGTSKKDTIAKFYLGGYAGYNLNMQFGGFNQLTTDCPTCVGADFLNYGFTIGSGFAIGGLFEYPLYKKLNGEIVKPVNNIAPMSIGARLGYSNLSANYNVETKIGNAINQAGNVTDGISAYILETDISVINFSPYFAYNFTDNLVGNIGLNFGYLLTSSFDSREELISPAVIVYKEEQARVRNQRDNQSVENANALQVGIGLGIGYQIPLGKYSFIIPEISYNFNFTNVASPDAITKYRINNNTYESYESFSSWKTSALQIGVAVKFPVLDYPPKERIIPEIFYQRDTIIVQKLGITTPEIVLNKVTRTPRGNDTLVVENYIKYVPKLAELTAGLNYYAMEKGQHKTIPSITIEEFETTESFPLLSIVYFQDGNADLNQTKMKLLSTSAVNSFDENKSKADIFELYHNMLNIMGKRLKASKARITIAGYSSGSGKDLEDRTIWQKRANAVRDYFVNVWGIDARRLKVEERKPERRDVSSASYNDVVEENQKVEIFADNNYELLKPITLFEIEKISSPPQVIFEMNGNSEAGLSSYSLVLSQSGNKLREYTDGNLHSEQFNTSKTWYITEEPLPMLERPVQASLTIKDKLNQETTKTLDIEILQKTISHKRTLIEDNMKIERYSLVLFDIDHAELTIMHKKVLDDVKKAIQPDSKLYIYGYADRTGDEQYNFNLALRRCEEVNNYINPGKKISSELEAVGSSSLIYNNDIPEGRAFSRTVKIEIRTPIK